MYRGLGFRALGVLGLRGLGELEEFKGSRIPQVGFGRVSPQAFGSWIAFWDAFWAVGVLLFVLLSCTSVCLMFVCLVSVCLSLSVFVCLTD